MVRGNYKNVERAPIRNKKGHLSEVKGGMGTLKSV